MASMRDVAQKANVSVATVSRVLNNNDTVSELTRNLVLQSALELNYPVDKWENLPRLAKSVYVLARDESIASNEGTPPIAREFERQVWQGVRSVFQQYEIVTSLQSSLMDEAEAIRYAEELGISGLVLLGGIQDSRFIQILQKKKIPFITVGASLPHYETNCVMADVFYGIRQIVRHLVQNGRSRIGFINGPDDTSTSISKLEGIRLELSLLGIPFKPQRITTAHFYPEAGYQQTKNLLAENPDLDAIIYADDVLAIGGGRALQEAGYRIPTDIAITGFGNYEIGRFSTPPLTSVHYDIFEMGKTAARRLKMIIDEPDDQNWLIKAPTKLKIRQSSNLF
jgi:DNA-binding LacI/PurR family transcriptional regulator